MQIAILEKYKRDRFDIIGRVDGTLQARILIYLDVNDILKLRLVCTGGHSSQQQLRRRYQRRMRLQRDILRSGDISVQSWTGVYTTVRGGR